MGYRLYDDDPSVLVTFGDDDGPHITLDVDDPATLYKIAREMRRARQVPRYRRPRRAGADHHVGRCLRRTHRVLA